MTRIEIYKELKAKNLVETANEYAIKKLTHLKTANYTHLKTEDLLKILSIKPACNSKCCTESCKEEVIDKKARNAIKILLERFGEKDIETLAGI